MQQLHPLQQINFTFAPQAHVVEASAGTGKTWTIERLFIKALLEASDPENASIPLSIDKLLVVTFTNDATDELKQRIQEQISLALNLIIYIRNQSSAELASAVASDIFIAYLYERQSKFDFRKDLTLLSRALQNFDNAAIYTIHGFCKRILNDYPFECSCHSDFELVASKASVIEQCVLEFMRSEIINNLLFEDHLAIVLHNLNRLFSSADFELTLEQRIAAKIPKDLFILRNHSYEVKFKLASTSDLAGLLLTEMSSEQQRVVKAQFIAYLVEYLAQRYPQLVAKSITISYDELIQKVADALANSTQLATTIFKLFPVAFIDEFQDTDALQWQIFSLIYLLNTDKRGNVVVVGDPKQAIYRFRGADVDTYLQARSQIGNQLSLNQNFRSHPHLMNFINQLFLLENQGCLLSESFLGNEIGYNLVEAVAAPKLQLPEVDSLQQIAREKGLASNQFYAGQVHLVAVNGATKEERSKKLLASMAFEILLLLNYDPKLIGKIAILVTKNREASEIVSYLRNYGIKAAELKLGNIFATQTAEELLRILNSIADLANHHAFLTALSVRVFNLDLSCLKRAQDQSNPVLEYWQKRFYHYKEVWEAQGIISLIYTLLDDLIVNQRQVSLTSESAATSGIITSRELANIWQLAELLNKQAAELHSQNELLFWFKQKVTQAALQLNADIDGNNEELVRLDHDDEQIVITTQHKAKGLEYEILFCPYFKSSIVLDGQYDFNYRRPFFSSYSQDGCIQAELVEDEQTGQKIVANDNKEAHRLNYVALTRAKSRIYIYLKQPTISRVTGKYNSLQRPDKLSELFGYQAHDVNAKSHRLFNYADFFSDDPAQALKQPQLLPGVVVYNRDDLCSSDLDKLAINAYSVQAKKLNFCYMNNDFKPLIGYTRQSYSGLSRFNQADSYAFKDYFVADEAASFTKLSYRYSILADPLFKGASFGVLFHELCEHYPFSHAELIQRLQHANIAPDFKPDAETSTAASMSDYACQLAQMLDEAFDYRLINDLSLNAMKHRQHELEFNLLIEQAASLNSQVAELVAAYFGSEHPFSLACRMLGQIEAGFLVGFIDLFFEYQGKYWVLDYKTNTLADYTSLILAKPAASQSGEAARAIEQTNPLLESMAEHHYYLQYLLYLVAIKRYLEQRLNLEDATDLLGGAIYYYVRGIYTTDQAQHQGVFVDGHCQNLVRDLDRLLLGEF